jgi:hypothetical protein
MLDQCDNLKKVYKKKLERENQSLSTNCSESLKYSVAILRQPVSNKIIHHHHIPKIILISAGLFILLCCCTVGWHFTAENLEKYKASDTKFRYLKLYNNNSVRQLLDFADSVYMNNSHMRDSAIQQEKLIENQLLLVKQVQETENKIKDLDNKIKH